MMISSVISIILIVGVMFYIDYRLTIISLFVYPLLVLVNNFLQKIISKEQANYLSKRQLLLKEIDDAVKCHDEIWTYNLLKAATNKFIKRSSDLEKSRIKLTVIGEFRSQASWVLIMVPYQAILYGIGGMWMIKTGDPTLGILMAFSNFTNFLINPVMRLVNTSSAISQAGVSYERIDRFNDIELQKDKFDYIKGKLAFADSLNFKYKESDKYILNEFKLDIDLNKITILWGQSGSGKSTLLKIVSGLLEADGIKIHDKLNENDFIRSDNFAYFPQSPNTFDGSVRDLFKMINPNIQEQKMLEILNEVGLYNHFKNKDGLDTIVKNSESTFSGGEHRRFCLALFLGYDADIMLFDEPTASLDKKSADMIINIISDLKNKNKTCVISTHDDALKNIGDEIIAVSK